MYLHSWIATAFSHSFPLSTVLRFWDSMLSESKSFGLSIDLLIFISAAIVLFRSKELKQLATDDLTEYLKNIGNTLSAEQSEIVLAQAYLLLKNTQVH